MNLRVVDVLVVKVILDRYELTTNGMSVIGTTGNGVSQLGIIGKVTYAHSWMCMCVEFRDEILFKGAGGECETLENPDFLRKDKMVILVKNQNFSRSRMTKRTSPLESSREI